MVVESYRRSFSFPVPNISDPTKIRGCGSTSLPIRFDPFISQLQDQTHSLRIWQSQFQTRSGSSAWICDGFARLDRLHASLDDLLHHPQTQDSLRRRSRWTAGVLDDFLRFADAYGSFRSAIVALKQSMVATLAAVRRGEEGRIAASVREQKRAEKEAVRVRKVVKGVGRWAAEGELAGIVREVVEVTEEATVAVVRGVGGVSAAAAAVAEGSLGRNHRKGEEGRGRAAESLERAVECVGEVEAKSERLFRSFVNARVYLLNILTPFL